MIDVISFGIHQGDPSIKRVSHLCFTRGCPPVYAREFHSDFEGFFVIGGSALQASEGGN